MDPALAYYIGIGAGVVGVVISAVIADWWAVVPIAALYLTVHRTSIK